MTKGIYIKKLKLKGLIKDYEYPFNRGLNIIAGPISTGKTSILEFIDYCFGAQSHPEHIEIQRKVRSVLLEIEINGDTLVIERHLFSTEKKATIHECSLINMGMEHVSKVIQTRHMPGQDSISSYLLSKLGLLGISLKEAPTKDNSGVDIMSFRNLMWFCFLQHERLDNKDLLFENVYIKNIKLHQVFDVIFKIHANELANLSFQIRNLESDIKRLDGEITTLTIFLNERNVPSRDKLEKQLEMLSKSEIESKERLSDITKTLKGESDIAQQLRIQFFRIDDDIRLLSAKKRDRDTLLKRLLPLRGQYSEDIKKLQLLQEAKKVFDPLGLVRCPYCLEEITQKADTNHCDLCGKTIAIEPVESFNVEKEIKSIEIKLNELGTFIQETDKELEEIKSNLEEKNKNMQGIRKKLDEAMREYVSPYISERDSIVGELTRIKQEIQDIETQLDLHNGIGERIKNKNQLEEILKTKQAEIESERLKVKGREDIINSISCRFGEILAAANFPKLGDPKINNDLVPSVRGLEYRKIGSSGAITLLSVSWFLSIFESAIELDGSHPGFIMIDSPQKNIGLKANKVEPEFRDMKIVEGLYRHIIKKSSEYGDNVQLILVDNEPPKIAENYITIQFSGRRDTPPYGLIDDEVE